MEDSGEGYYTLRQIYRKNLAGHYEAIEILNTNTIEDGASYIITKDGTLPEDINNYFLYLGISGSSSLATQKAYGQDLTLWLNFLKNNLKKQHWEADRHDVGLYHNARRSNTSTSHISANSWNRSCAALAKFYNYGVINKFTEKNPFTETTTLLVGDTPVYTNVLHSRESNTPSSTPQALTQEEYATFKKVGIQGTGTHFTNEDRNLALAELLYLTGMRIAEANSLTILEITNLPRKTTWLTLPAEITKGGKLRKVPIIPHMLTLLHKYIKIERAIVVASNQNTYKNSEHIVKRKTNTTVLTQGGKTISLKNLTKYQRQTYILQNSDGTFQPLALWLTNKGTPTGTQNWSQMFNTATQRCMTAGQTFSVSPHTLRHTFAINMLKQLDKTNSSAHPSGAALRQVQLLLGHASILTTQQYLGNIDIWADTTVKAAQDILPETIVDTNE